jgi:penicillin-binding protein 1A
MIAAYSTFATLGVRAQPNAILRVENAKHQVLWQPTPERTQVLTPEQSWLMVSMMKDVVQRGTAASVYASGFHYPAGGKTGTTNDYTNVWFIGYTADLVAGVWMGFDKPKPIEPNAQGGTLAAPAWTNFMTEVYRRKPAPPDWPMPPSIVVREIDARTGLLYTPQCIGGTMMTEFFLPGTEPTAECTGYMPIPIGTPPTGAAPTVPSAIRTPVAPAAIPGIPSGTPGGQTPSAPVSSPPSTPAAMAGTRADVPRSEPLRSEPLRSQALRRTSPRVTR